MQYVLDASFYASLILPDEKDEYVLNFFSTKGKDDTMYVPHLWWYEMGNILKKAIMRKRIAYLEAQELISMLSALNVITDTEFGGAYAHTLLKLAHDYNLTVYDAAYLELAERKKAVLGTLDGNLKTAAVKYGVEAL
ncbi:MAG: type II toxin-antitoxin system VapC family toxin [Treponema sp.]|jgi:predicted nucleic acid-binding protein|nr:type II toxin-antitoxin system VapC family toxin [Treponema sp.]